MKMNKRLMRLSGVMLSASVLVSCLGVPALAADSLAKMEKNETVYISPMRPVLPIPSSCPIG